MSNELAPNFDPIETGNRQFVEAINSGYARYPDFDQLPLSNQREIAEGIRREWRADGPEMAETRDFAVEGIRVRLHRPTEDEPLPVLIYIHGGGWMYFSNDTHDRLMREYAAGAGIAVIGIEYSRSPEAKFPVALNEVATVQRWLAENASDCALDTDRVAIGGDSAGANLAMSACLLARAEERLLPQALLLNYGAFSPEPMPSYEKYGGALYSLNPEEMDTFWTNYVDDPAQLNNPLVAPVDADLKGFPPAFLAIAECDILADCNQVLADRFEAAGINTTARTYAGTTHSFLEAMMVSEIARKAIKEQSDWLAKVLRS